MNIDEHQEYADALVAEAKQAYEAHMARHRKEMRRLDWLEELNRQHLRIAGAWLFTVAACGVVALAALIWRRWPY